MKKKFVENGLAEAEKIEFQKSKKVRFRHSDPPNGTKARIDNSTYPILLTGLGSILKVLLLFQFYWKITEIWSNQKVRVSKIRKLLSTKYFLLKFGTPHGGSFFIKSCKTHLSPIFWNERAIKAPKRGFKINTNWNHWNFGLKCSNSEKWSPDSWSASQKTVVYQISAKNIQYKANCEFLKP